MHTFAPKLRVVHLIWLGAAIALTGHAEVRLPSLFTDHMVLQQDVAAPVWGTANPGEEVTVSIAGQSVTTKADSHGKWQVSLAPIKSEQPLELTVRASNSLVVKDVLAGEVWLCAGQSNMVMTVANSKDYEIERQSAHLPQIRMFTVGAGRASKAQADCPGSWVVCTPESVGSFSAVAFYFGRDLHKRRGSPIGLINSSAGGTLIESWLNFRVQRDCEALNPFFTLREKLRAPLDAKNPADASKIAVLNVGGLFNGKIAPLIPYAMRGIIWYQGESNAHPDRAHFYETQLRLLVRDWRACWGSELPFAWVQLPNLQKKMPWPEIREAQLRVLDLPSTGMAITIDVGESKNTHPTNKQVVGQRLALWALGAVYGEKVPAVSGPLPAGHEIRDHEIILRFTHANGGLLAKDGPLKGFVIAGADRAWKPAAARIENDTVIVSAPQVPQPVAVRYAWASDPVCNLFNGAGLPASPFRTDTWDPSPP